METVDAFTVDEFCRAHRMSRSTFYKLLREERGPRTFRLGSRMRVSREAAEDWRRKMEREAQA